MISAATCKLHKAFTGNACRLGKSGPCYRYVKTSKSVYPLLCKNFSFNWFFSFFSMAWWSLLLNEPKLLFNANCKPPWSLWPGISFSFAGSQTITRERWFATSCFLKIRNLRSDLMTGSRVKQIYKTILFSQLALSNVFLHCRTCRWTNIMSILNCFDGEWLMTTWCRWPQSLNLSPTKKCLQHH